MQPAVTKPNMLAVGDTSSPEFAHVMAVLHSGGSLFQTPDLASAGEHLLVTNRAVDLLVLFQSLPGQFDAEELAAVRRELPLLRVVVVLGSWCEGEARTGKPLPATLRWYWYEAPARFTREFEAIAAGRCPGWGLPLTADAEDAILEQARHGRAESRGLIAVCAATFETADALCNLVAQAGFGSVWLRPEERPWVRGAAAGIWSATHCSPREAVQLRALKKLLGDAPIVALLDFPRWEDREHALQAGATEVLARPFQNEDVVWLLREWTERTEQAASHRQRA